MNRRKASNVVSSRWQRLRRSPLIIAGAFMTVWGILFGAVGWSAVKEDSALRLHGQTATAFITAKSIKRADETTARSTHYQMAYEFAAGNGAVVRSARDVDFSTWDTLRQGDAIEVVYLPSFPQTNRPAQDMVGTGGDEIVGIVGTVVCTVGLVLVAIGIKRRKINPSARARSASSPAGHDSAVQAFGDQLFARIGPRAFATFLLVSIGLIFLAAGGIPLFQYHRLSLEGRTTVGMIMTKGESSSQRSGAEMRSSGTLGSPTYWATYRFRVGDQAVAGQQSNLRFHVYHALRELGPVAIEYLPQRPSINRIAGSGPPIADYFVAGFGALMSTAGVAVYGLWSILGSRTRSRRVHRQR